LNTKEQLDTAAFASVAECKSDTPVGGTTHTATRGRRAKTLCVRLKPLDGPLKWTKQVASHCIFLEDYIRTPLLWRSNNGCFFNKFGFQSFCLPLYVVAELFQVSFDAS
jgi:hypothetical protein